MVTVSITRSFEVRLSHGSAFATTGCQTPMHYTVGACGLQETVSGPIDSRVLVRVVGVPAIELLPGCG